MAKAPLNAQFQAHCDGIQDTELQGWGWYPHRPDMTLLVEIVLDGSVVTTMAADLFRTDLAAAGIRNGYAGFSCSLPDQAFDGSPHVVETRIKGHKEVFHSVHIDAAKPSFEAFSHTSSRRFLLPRSATLDNSPVQASGDREPIPISAFIGVAEAFRDLAKTTIIIAVYNAAVYVQACLAAVRRCTTANISIFVVDDASTDAAIPVLLAQACLADCRVRVVRNSSNIGYTRSINNATRSTDGDIVLLNSDTIVTPRWLENMLAAAHGHDRIGTVTALSDNAGAFSVPRRGQRNHFPLNYTTEELGRAIADVSPGLDTAVPTGNGFCMYIRRRMIEDVGLFDEVSFPRGYGEENDFCLRGARRGWDSIIDDRTLVFHVRSASFAAEAAGLIKRAGLALAERYPDYAQAIRIFDDSLALRQIRTAIQQRLEQLSDRHPSDTVPPSTLPRILYILHDLDDGGTGLTTRDLMNEIGTQFACLVLVSRGSTVCLWQFDGNSLSICGAWALNRRPTLFVVQQTDYTALLTYIVVSQRIELVHIRHLMNHPLEVPRLAKQLGLPVVMSLHDYYLVCPTVNLLDDAGSYCGGHCGPSKGKCQTPALWQDGLPPLKHGMVFEWRRRVRPLLEAVDAFVTTSLSAGQVLNEHFPEIGAAGLRIIEHGRGFDEQRSLAQIPSVTEPVRIAVLGQLNSRHKGAEVVRALHAIDGGRRLELHFIGANAADVGPIGTCYGPYRRDSLPEQLGKIRPSFVLLPAIWAETYSHTLSEAWACGIPVIAPRLGAIAERIDRWGGGWTVTQPYAATLYDLILRLASNPQQYAAELVRAKLTNIRSAAEMAQDYRVLYKQMLAQQRSQATRPAAVALEALRIAFLAPGSDTRAIAPPALRSRWLRILDHPCVAELADGAVIPPSALPRWAAGGGRRVVVTPAFGEPACLEGLRAARSHGVRVICDAGLPALAGSGAEPVVQLGSPGDVLVAADENPLEYHAGLVDERPWLWAADRRAKRRPSPAGLPPHVGLVVDPADLAAMTVAAAIVSAGTLGGRWRASVIHAGGAVDAPALRLPGRDDGDDRLIDWLADELDSDIAVAVQLTPNEVMRGIHWRLLGIVCLEADDSAAGDGFAMSAQVIAADAWINRLQALLERPAGEGAEETRHAALDSGTLRRQPQAFVTWLLGSSERAEPAAWLPGGDLSRRPVDETRRG